MRSEELRTLREDLERRRRQLVEVSRHADADIAGLRGEREIEFGDEAQAEEAQARLDRLGEVERAEIARIDAALARMEAGRYGLCRACGDPIDRRRLDAMPFALECLDCAEQAGRR
jgi:DnaK suppressor protein